jgi:ribosome biogenesis SPOUT family RNA methylase Rps3
VEYGIGTEASPIGKWLGKQHFGDAKHVIGASRWAVAWFSPEAPQNEQLVIVGVLAGQFVNRDGTIKLNAGEAACCVSHNGDVDANGCVDDADLLAVLLAFGGQGYRNEDLNWDGVIDDADLLIVLFNFGSGC